MERIMWKITIDHLADEYGDNKGIQTKGFDPMHPNLKRVRLYDDDDILYADALCTNNDAIEDLFDWYQRDSGTTRLDMLVHGECKGHESTDGPIGNTVYCDGTCEQGKWEQVIS